MSTINELAVLRAIVDPELGDLESDDLAERYTVIREAVRRFAPGEIRTESGHTVFEPWSDGFAVGFKVTDERTRTTRYVYLNPSTDCGTERAGDDGTVFLYDGSTGDPAVDIHSVHVDVLGSISTTAHETAVQGRDRAIGS